MKPDDMPALTYRIPAPPRARAARRLFRFLQRLRAGRLDLVGPDGCLALITSDFEQEVASNRGHNGGK